VTRLGRGIVLLGLLLATGCSMLRQPVPTAAPVPPPTVTAEQVARAMQDDHFFSDYRGQTLLVQGTVSSVEQRNGETLVTLSSGLPTGVVCDVGNATAPAKAGDVVTARTQASNAQRSGSTVLLRPCSLGEASVGGLTPGG
jgi:hypothetical protein